MKAEMFWFKNLRIKGIQLANTRCWLINSNCRYKQREIFPGKKLMATGKRLAGFEKDRPKLLLCEKVVRRKALKGNFRSSSVVFKVMTSWNLILDSLPSKTRISSEFCPEKLFRSKLEGFLHKGTAFKIENHGQFFARVNRFLPSLSLAVDTEWAFCNYVVQNPPCWRASSLLFPHWDIKTKRPEPVNLHLPLFWCPSGGIIMSLPSSMADFVPRDR